jgi:mono/diheme cytochrome c family protein
MTRRKAVLVILQIVLISYAIFAGTTHSPDYTAVQNQTGRLTTEEAKKLKSPIPFSKESIARGRAVFARNCTACHGADGKSEVDVVANASDLTEPKLWRSGTAEGEIFRSIRDGAGDTMPSFKSQLQKEEDLWHLVNFIRSLWPESMRPKLQ